NTGCLRQLTLMPCPGTTFEMSTSVVASASTSAEGDIWTMRGVKAATVPTPAKLTAATFKKSRRRTPSGGAAAFSETPADCALAATILTFDANGWLVPEGTSASPHRASPGAIGGPDSEGFKRCEGA